MRLLREPEVRRLIPLGKTQFHELVKRGDIPRPIALSERRVAWVESEIFAWIERRIEARDAPPDATSDATSGARGAGQRRTENAR